jgi:rod shape-determining protein MreC
MTNLIAFLRRFRVFLFFALLQMFSLIFYVNYLVFPRNQYLTTASLVSGKVLEAEHDLTKHFNLSDNNLALQKENIKLRKKLKESLYKVSGDFIFVSDSLYQQQYSYIPATIINSTVSKRNNYFTLNIGRKQGVYKGLGVFSEKGVVGIIHNTSEHYSVVKSVLTKDINIDVTIQPIGLFGLLKWNGRDARRGSISGISNDLRIKKWSKVITKGGSGIFPRGLSVGVVEKINPVNGEPLWDVVVKFSENYRTIQRVYVVKNLMIKEQKKIEDNIPIDEEE